MSADDLRPDPDALLARVREEEMRTKSGHLHLFLGMCPGVGKTYAMLQAARQRLNEGVDVLVGVVETHGRPETAALLEGLAILPPRAVEHRGILLGEFDLDGALARRPGLVLVDELAHTNSPGSRHPKRYQDVLELIDAGIDVYTTLNVQHIESQVDIVRQITGIAIQETVPDSVLDRADEIQLIDLSVEQLLERLGEGKVYLGDRVQRALTGFFKEGNLTALRELALRFTAEQVDRDLVDIRRARRIDQPWKANARLLVGVGPSPYAESLIRWTRRAASRLGCPWLVVWVEGLRELTPAEQERLTAALGLARRLGGEVVTATGGSVEEGLLRVARERNATQIVVGKPEKTRWFRHSLADRIILGSGDIDVCVVRPLAPTAPSRHPEPPRAATPGVASDYSWVIVAVFALASICQGLVAFTGYLFVALVFLLAVVLAAMRFSRGPVLLMAALSALCWNFFFIPPRFTFAIGRLEDWLMFGLFFIVALSMGSLTSRLRLREAAERRRARQNEALLRVTQCAALATDLDEGLGGALRAIDESLRARSALVLPGESRSGPVAVHPASTFQPTPKELSVAHWAFANRREAGRDTDTLPEADVTWFPLQTATSVPGVLGLQFDDDRPLDFATRQMVEAFSLQLALVLEKESFLHAIAQTEELALSEKLHRNLLDNVSHELKTPLAIIRAALEGAGSSGSPYLEEIAIATRRLQRVVDGLLQMNRLESGALTPRLDWCDLRDIIATARRALGGQLESHPLRVHLAEPFPLLKLDHHLLAQTLANLLHNAAVHTPEGSPVEISASLEGGGLVLTVRDHGPGLPCGAERRLFEKFFRAPGAPAGGTGLGLAIARGFAQAMGGDLTARNHPGGGAEFVLRIDRVDLFEEPPSPTGADPALP